MGITRCHRGERRRVPILGKSTGFRWGLSWGRGCILVCQFRGYLSAISGMEAMNQVGRDRENVIRNDLSCYPITWPKF